MGGPSTGFYGTCFDYCVDFQQWKERARDYKRGDDFQRRKTVIRIKNFVKKQHRYHGKNGEGDVTEEKDEEDSDFHDPLELPGPVQGTQKSRRHKVRGPLNVYDLLSGSKPEVRSYIQTLPDDKSTKAVQHTGKYRRGKLEDTVQCRIR